MLKASLAAVGLLFSVMAVAHNDEVCQRELFTSGSGTFAPKQISKTFLSKKNGWELLWHRTSAGEVQLLAFHRSTLLLRRIDPLTGSVISDKQFLTANSNAPSSVIAQSTEAGEVVIAAARAADKAVDLYSDRSDFKITAYLDQDVRQIHLISLNGGRDVFVAASTINTITLFRRAGNKLEKVSFIESQPLLHKTYAFEAGDGQIAIASLSSDHKVRVFNWDDQVDELKERPGFVQLGGRTTPFAVNGQVLFVSTDTTTDGGNPTRVFSTGTKTFGRSFDLKSVIGSFSWDAELNGQPHLLVPVRNGTRSELLRIDPLRGRVMDITALGDARTVTDLSQFRLGNKSFYIFTRDGSMVTIQSDNETSVLPAPARSRINQTTGVMRLHDGQIAVAVLGQSQSGVSVNVVSLSAGR